MSLDMTPVHRNLHTKVTFLGLEFEDAPLHLPPLWVLPAVASPDGRLLATISADQCVRIWDARTGRAVTRPLRHSAKVQFAEFDPSGRRLATGTSDGTARVWDVATGTLVGAPLRNHGGLRQAVLGPGGRQGRTDRLSQARCRRSEPPGPLHPAFSHRQLSVTLQRPGQPNPMLSRLENTDALLEQSVAPARRVRVSPLSGCRRRLARMAAARGPEGAQAAVRAPPEDR